MDLQIQGCLIVNVMQRMLLCCVYCCQGFEVFNFHIFVQMLMYDTRFKIGSIVSGVILEGSEDHCTAIRNVLGRRFETSKVVKADFDSKARA